MAKHQIISVEKNSIAAKMGISGGDFLLSINKREVRDILDYRFFVQDYHLLLEIEKANGEIWEIDIEKDPDEGLGINFKHALLSPKRKCRNNCVFCFIDQQPPGLRSSLYVKDDDVRLSFLQGNYVTLTNLGPAEVARIASYHLSPLRISVHAADLQLRQQLMGTPAACNLFDALETFHKASIDMHFQIVLCKGMNDGTSLDETIKKLLTFKPFAKSLSVVPAGLTRHRHGLAKLEQFTAEDARAVIAQVAHWQGKTPFVHLSDEWYILAQVRLPKYKDYGNFEQLDNGVGVVRVFEREFLRGMASDAKQPICKQHETVGIITGTAAAWLMRALATHFMKMNPKIKIKVFEVSNNFFGTSVTVSGLLTGQDIIKQLASKLGGVKRVYVPSNAFRAGVKEDIMLDGTTLKQLAAGLDTKVIIGSTNGYEFCKQLYRG